MKTWDFGRLESVLLVRDGWPFCSDWDIDLILVAWMLLDAKRFLLRIKFVALIMHNAKVTHDLRAAAVAEHRRNSPPNPVTQHAPLARHDSPEVSLVTVII